MQFNIQQQAAHRNLSYLIAEKIAHRILSNEFSAESLLPGENELCEIYKVSRTAIREAVKMLTAKGMLLARPRIGTRVMPKHYWNFLDKDLLSWWISQDSFTHVSEHFVVLRKALEPQAAALAALNADDEQCNQLGYLSTEMQLLSKHFDLEKWISVDTEFHKIIYNASGNPLMISFSSLFNTVYKKYVKSIDYYKQANIEQHQFIVNAILQKNSTEAFRATQELLEKVIRSYNH